MLQNVKRMSGWIFLFYVLGSVGLSKCELHLIIFNYVNGMYEPLKSNVVEVSAGLNLNLECVIGGPGVYSNPELRWGIRSKDFRFKNETDLIRLAKENNTYLTDLNDKSIKYYSSKAYLDFYNIGLSNHGTYFCMSLKYMLFKIIHIKVKDEYLDSNIRKTTSECGKDKFQCVSSGYCINEHYKCDGKPDCQDRSDEKRKLCNGDPCRNKIRCNDDRCIPVSWCCDKYTDSNCNVTVRPSCCPPIPDPYDPLNFYNEKSNVNEIPKSNTSKYLFITICVVSAILSFLLFLFVISKMCGFKNNTNNRQAESLPRCEHSACIIRREFDLNMRCLYQNSRSSVQCSDNNNDLGDPLIIIQNIERNSNDQPPSYAEVVETPPNIDKTALNDLMNALPPPYSSTKYFKTENSRTSPPPPFNFNIGDNSNNTS